MIIGINYPWKIYGADFGELPHKKNASEWKKSVREDMTALQQLGFKAIRWFILGDGLTYGTGGQAPEEVTLSNGKKDWRFHDPPPFDSPNGITDYSIILKDFEWVLQLFSELGLMMVPSLIDFHWCRPGREFQTGFIKGGRQDIINDVSKRKKFFDRVLNPFLTISDQYRNTIYAWELINEPEWVTRMKRKYDADKKTVSWFNMYSFIKEGVGRINAWNFDSTIGFSRISSITKKRRWLYNSLGIRRHQFHYYPKLCPRKEAIKLPDHKFSEKYPCFIGEIATETDCPYYVWPDLDKDHQGLVDRIKLTDIKKYPAVFLWSMNANDHPTDFEKCIETLNKIGQ